MKKINFLIFGMLLFSLNSCLQEQQVAEKKIDTRPNFLFILADDQAFSTIGSLNNSEIKTPNLDKISASGMTFTHCFNQGAWGGAVCVASRSMVNSGQNVFATREGLNKNQTWGETFTKAGYETFLTGKWHNGFETALRSFKYAKSIGKGMYETLHPEFGRKPGYARPTPENNSWDPTDPLYTGHWAPHVNDIVYDENGNKKLGPTYTVKQHTSELYASNAIEFLQNKGTETGNPFLMYVAFNAPHDPRQAPKRFVDMYPKDQVEIPENFLPEHPFDQGDHKLRDEILAPFPRTEHQIQVHRREYYAIISHMDEQIGKILTALEKSGKADNTYIIFSADHGLAVGEHGLLGKQNQYDHSVRMPFFISGPGITAGKQSDAMIYMQSVFATTCELAGIEAPATVDFPSLKGVIEGKEQKVHDAVMGSYRNLQRMVRTDTHKLILYPHNGMQQLFDLTKDPREMVNIIDDAANENLKNEMFAKLLALQKEVGDTLSLSIK